MKPADASHLSERVDRFLRWFFTASPEAVVEVRPVSEASEAKARSRTVSRRKPTRLRAQHSGPVRLPVKVER